LLIAKKRYSDAWSRLQRHWPGTSECSNGFDDVLWTLERARVASQLGHAGEAAASYALVASAWRNADPELQPFAREARDGLARLRRAGDSRSH
jgi:serine/threonine-protein kinase